MALLLLLLGAIVFWPLIIVFVLYLMFRSKKEVCPKCSGNMIDENSPIGKRLKLQNRTFLSQSRHQQHGEQTMKLEKIALYLTIIPGFFWIAGIIQKLLSFLLINPVSKEITTWFLSILLSSLIIFSSYYLPILRNKVFVYLPHNDREEPHNILTVRRLLFTAIVLVLTIIVLTITLHILKSI